MPAEDDDRPTVVITGASSGVGRSLTHHLAGRYQVIAAARRVERMEEEYAGTATVHPRYVDLSDPRDVERFCARTLEEFGTVRYLVNNAGVNRRSRIEHLRLDDLADHVQVNALAPLQVMQAFLPRMVASGHGRIVNVTSGAPFNCFEGFGAYSGSKALLNALTVTAAKEYAHEDIRINLMSPGPVRSEMAPDAPLDPAVCHATADHLLELDASGPTGGFYWLGYEVPLFPDLRGIDWLTGEADGAFERVIEP